MEANNGFRASDSGCLPRNLLFAVSALRHIEALSTRSRNPASISQPQTVYVLVRAEGLSFGGRDRPTQTRPPLGSLTPIRRAVGTDLEVRVISY